MVTTYKRSARPCWIQNRSTDTSTTGNDFDTGGFDFSSNDKAETVTPDTKVDAPRNRTEHSVHSTLRMQEAGEAQTTVDDFEYLMGGVENDASVEVRRSSVLKLVSHCQSSVTRFAMRAHGLLPRVLHLVQVAESSEDEALKLCSVSLALFLFDDRRCVEYFNHDLAAVLLRCVCTITQSPDGVASVTSSVKKKNPTRAGSGRQRTLGGNRRQTRRADVSMQVRQLLRACAEEFSDMELELKSDADEHSLGVGSEEEGGNGGGKGGHGGVSAGGLIALFLKARPYQQISRSEVSLWALYRAVQSAASLAAAAVSASRPEASPDASPTALASSMNHSFSPSASPPASTSSSMSASAAAAAAAAGHAATSSSSLTHVGGELWRLGGVEKISVLVHGGSEALRGALCSLLEGGGGGCADLAGAGSTTTALDDVLLWLHRLRMFLGLLEACVGFIPKLPVRELSSGCASEVGSGVNSSSSSSSSSSSGSSSSSNSGMDGRSGGSSEAAIVQLDGGRARLKGGGEEESGGVGTLVRAVLLLVSVVQDFWTAPGESSVEVLPSRQRGALRELQLAALRILVNVTHLNPAATAAFVNATPTPPPASNTPGSAAAAAATGCVCTPVISSAASSSSQLQPRPSNEVVSLLRLLLHAVPASAQCAAPKVNSGGATAAAAATAAPSGGRGPGLSAAGAEGGGASLEGEEDGGVGVGSSGGNGSGFDQLLLTLTALTNATEHDTTNRNAVAALRVRRKSGVCEYELVCVGCCPPQHDATSPSLSPTRSSRTKKGKGRGGGKRGGAGGESKAGAGSDKPTPSPLLVKAEEAVSVVAFLARFFHQNTSSFREELRRNAGTAAATAAAAATSTTSVPPHAIKSAAASADGGVAAATASPAGPAVVDVTEEEEPEQKQTQKQKDDVEKEGGGGKAGEDTTEGGDWCMEELVLAAYTTMLLACLCRTCPTNQSELLAAAAAATATTAAATAGPSSSSGDEVVTVSGSGSGSPTAMFVRVLEAFVALQNETGVLTRESLEPVCQLIVELEALGQPQQHDRTDDRRGPRCKSAGEGLLAKLKGLETGATPDAVEGQEGEDEISATALVDAHRAEALKDDARWGIGSSAARAGDIDSLWMAGTVASASAPASSSSSSSSSSSNRSRRASKSAKSTAAKAPTPAGGVRSSRTRFGEPGEGGDEESLQPLSQPLSQQSWSQPESGLSQQSEELDPLSQPASQSSLSTSRPRRRNNRSTAAAAKEDRGYAVVNASISFSATRAGAETGADAGVGLSQSSAISVLSDDEERGEQAVGRERGSGDGDRAGPGIGGVEEVSMDSWAMELNRSAKDSTSYPPSRTKYGRDRGRNRNRVRSSAASAASGVGAAVGKSTSSEVAAAPSPPQPSPPRRKPQADSRRAPADSGRPRKVAKTASAAAAAAGSVTGLQNDYGDGVLGFSDGRGGGDGQREEDVGGKRRRWNSQPVDGYPNRSQPRESPARRARSPSRRVKRWGGVFSATPPSSDADDSPARRGVKNASSQPSPSGSLGSVASRRSARGSSRSSSSGSSSRVAAKQNAVKKAKGSSEAGKGTRGSALGGGSKKVRAAPVPTTSGASQRGGGTGEVGVFDFPTDV